ncbi:diguanylate cyclase domain-containing protein, partial [Halopseudomonas sp.]|uniref:diguanylate cyclase domain-containing protein n=1 Tax=Halopseudomonas sp. TaxID=2901191 RepID=UPI003001C0EB
GSKRARPLLPEAVDVIIAANFNRLLALVQGQDELDSVAERLRDSFCRHAFELEDGPLEVTISLGTALAAAQDVDGAAQNLIARADAALYRAKREGRNRVVRG